jgi:mRNA interferase MazF
MIYQGEIVIAKIPFSNFKHAKDRPNLVISNSKLNKTNDVIVAAISGESYEPFSIEINEEEDFLEGSLQKQSFVHCNKVLRIQKSLIQNVVAKASPQLLQKVLTQIQSYLRQEQV